MIKVGVLIQTDFLNNGLDALVLVLTETLTMRDMLSHRSGLPSHNWIWWGSDFSRRDMLARLRHLKPNAPIRSRFQYYNLPYMLASLIVEEVAGRSWKRFVQTRNFDV